MFSFTNMPSSSSLLSAYTTFTAASMLVRTMLSELQNVTNQLIPRPLQERILSKFQGLMGNISCQGTVVIDEYNGLSLNEMFEASEIYLRTKISPTVARLKVSKAPGENSLSVTINKGEKIIDTFEGIELVWQMICTETQRTSNDYEGGFTHVLERSNGIKEGNKVVKLYSLSGLWSSVNRRVGKAWKRGYLLYGPPGTGKSSLIAAMANYLKFHVYDMELTSIHYDEDLRRALLSTSNRSILVIEDIDCSSDFQNRQDAGYNQGDKKVTLSGLLNFVDGLWSSCGDERIFIFTTNHKDRLDPALLRPGRMDMHIHMSYCTPDGFKILASNYLGITSHFMFPEIEKLITAVEATPAEIAEELMKSEQANLALAGLVKFLHCSKNGGEAFRRLSRLQKQQH